MQQPCQRDLRRGGPPPGGDRRDRRVGRQLPRTAGEGRAERKERHERELALLAQRQHVLLGAIDDAVGILDARDIDELERPADGVGRGVGDPDQVELALLAQILQRAQLLGQPTFGVVLVEQAQVDEIDPLELQRAQVVLDAGAQVGRRVPGSQPPTSSRRAPTLVTSFRSSGYGYSASRISSLTTFGP